MSQDSGMADGASQSESACRESETVVDPGIAYVKASRESIATTPVEGTSIIDIVKGFQVIIGIKLLNFNIGRIILASKKELTC